MKGNKNIIQVKFYYNNTCNYSILLLVYSLCVRVIKLFKFLTLMMFFPLKPWIKCSLSARCTWQTYLILLGI